MTIILLGVRREMSKQNFLSRFGMSDDVWKGGGGGTQPSQGVVSPCELASLSRYQCVYAISVTVTDDNVDRYVQNYEKRVSNQIYENEREEVK